MKQSIKSATILVLCMVIAFVAGLFIERLLSDSAYFSSIANEAQAREIIAESDAQGLMVMEKLEMAALLNQDLKCTLRSLDKEEFQTGNNCI